MKSPQNERGAHHTHEAFLLMLKDNQDMLNKITSMFCRDEDDRMELMQEILYSAWASFQEFRGESSLRTWLYAVAFGTATKYRRHRRQWEKIVEEIRQDFADDTRQAGDDMSEKVDEIYALAGSHKEIVKLLLQGYEYTEIAASLGIQPSILRSRVQRLKRRLGLKSGL